VTGVSTYSVTRDEGRGSWFWCAWHGIVKGGRTRSTPSAHGWAPDAVAAKAAARAACTGQPIENTELAKSVVGWKKYAVPGFTRDEVDARREAAEKVIRDAFTADFERRLNASKANGTEAFFWETERMKFHARREAFESGLTSTALSALGLTSTATAEDVRRAYRLRAKTAHPDRGGSDAAFVKLTKTYQAALIAIGATS
jgi:hypothetical protein